MKLRALLLNKIFYLFKFKLFIICLLSLGSATTWAFEQTNKSCALTAWQIYKIIDNAQQGMSREQQLSSLKSFSAPVDNIDPVYSTISQHGYSVAYDSLHVNIITCLQKIKNESKKLEPEYLKCLGQAAVRIHLLTDIKNKKNADYIHRKYSFELEPLYEMLNRRVNDTGYLNAVKFSAGGFAECVEKIVQNQSLH